MKSIHFISGLPRSGSTLLAAILSQNPKFHASMTSPLHAIFQGAYHAMSNGETSVFVDDFTREKILLGIFMNFYSGRNGSMIDKIAFDTNRGWTNRHAQISKLFPDAKMICCVRSVNWIVDSFERITRANPLLQSKIFSTDAKNNTVYGRANGLTQPNGIVGSAWEGLRDACFSEMSERIMLVRYNSIVNFHRDVVSEIHKFIGADSFDYDFSDICFPPDQAQLIEEFDARLQCPGLHRISGPIRDTKRDPIIPPDIFMQHSKASFWQEDEFAKVFKGIIV